MSLNINYFSGTNITLWSVWAQEPNFCFSKRRKTLIAHQFVVPDSIVDLLQHHLLQLYFETATILISTMLIPQQFLVELPRLLLLILRKSKLSFLPKSTGLVHIYTNMKFHQIVKLESFEYLNMTENIRNTRTYFELTVTNQGYATLSIKSLRFMKFKLQPIGSFLKISHVKILPDTIQSLN